MLQARSLPLLRSQLKKTYGAPKDKKRKGGQDGTKPSPSNKPMIPIFQVDSFTSIPFQGNPAGVCLLDKAYPDSLLQNLALEMNLSETAFLLGEELRFFTPKTEVNLCGHATLATAHILWETKRKKSSDALYFQTKSGPLFATKTNEGIRLTLPLDEAIAAPIPKEVLEALNLREEPVFTGYNSTEYLVEIRDNQELLDLDPDQAKLALATTRGVIVTSYAKKGPYDFWSRFFSPAIGIPEDPVTGSAHACLGPYWAKKKGQSLFAAWQCGKRGGNLKLHVQPEKVHILGEAVTIFSGTLNLGLFC